MPAPSERSALHRRGLFAARAAAGGVLMGLANLVPGISGGTMLLAAGVYPAFVGSIAELTRLRLRPRPLLIVGVIAGAALLTIASFAGAVGSLVVHQRWIMYSLFIGLTLGGVPVVWPMVRPATTGPMIAALAGFAAMVIIALIDPQPQGAHGGMLILLIAGAAGGSAMILPGVSGGYLLLVLGQYVAILAAVDGAFDALRAGDWPALGAAMRVVVPVGIGVVLGVVGISNLVEILLERWPRTTAGFLLGLLVGAVVGLWPFQAPVAPQIGDVIAGRVIESDADAALIPAEQWPTALFTPTPPQVMGSLGLIAGGIVLALAVGRIGRGKQEAGDSEFEI